MSVCLGRNFGLAWWYLLDLLILWALECKIYLASHMFLKLCHTGTVNFSQSLYFCLCLNPINLSYCLSHLLHQGVLVEASKNG